MHTRLTIVRSLREPCRTRRTCGGFGNPLQAGRTCDWVVNAVGGDGGQLATGDSRFVVQP